MISARPAASASSSKSNVVATLRFPQPLCPEAQLAKLLKQSCELLLAGFDKLDTLIEDYLKEVTFTSRDTGRSDADRFLRWINTSTSVTAEQQDLITCLKSRFAVEFIAFKRRLAFHRFQEMAAKSQLLIEQNGLTDKAILHLNPLNVWARFETHVLLDEETVVPATVLFYPNAQGVQTTVLGDDALAIVKQLETKSLTLKKLLKGKTEVEKSNLETVIKDMLKQGILAIQ